MEAGWEDGGSTVGLERRHCDMPGNHPGKKARFSWISSPAPARPLREQQHHREGSGAERAGVQGHDVTPEHSWNKLAMPACTGSSQAEHKPHISIVRARPELAEHLCPRYGAVRLQRTLELGAGSAPLARGDGTRVGKQEPCS